MIGAAAQLRRPDKFNYKIQLVQFALVRNNKLEYNPMIYTISHCFNLTFLHENDHFMRNNVYYVKSCKMHKPAKTRAMLIFETITEFLINFCIISKGDKNGF